MSGPRATPAPGPSFAVVIPMYNEEAGAERCVTEVCRELSSLPQRSRLIVVNDGSQDRTREILARLASLQPLLRVVEQTANRGYGAALRSGTEAAGEEGFNYALFMDSDLTNAPSDIPRFVEKMAEGADVIKATRYSGGGGVRGVPFNRWIVSAVGNWIAQLLFGIPIHDATNGFRAVKVPLLRRMILTEPRFSIIMEELYWCRLLARTYAEVPVVLTSREAHQRVTAFRYSPAEFARYLKYPLRAFLGRAPESETRVVS